MSKVLEFKKGEFVYINNQGLSNGKLARVVDIDELPVNLQNTATQIVTCILIENGHEVIVPNTNLVYEKRHMLKCECGGDALDIPHHYSWCPKGAK